NERDVGAFFYFETPDVRRRFKRLVDSGLKGSGDYGMTAVGVSNGQPLNTRERNDNKHFFARVTYPFDVGSQTLELSAAAYTGLFVPSKAEGIGGAKELQDLRGLATFVLYPKPFGFQAEYNVGYGPELVGNTIERRALDGGYAMIMWRQKTSVGYLTPYVRVHRYDGGKKFEQNAPRHEVRELNVGLEWQIQRWVELTGELMASDRTVNGTRQEGRLLRLQLQFNY
ncbi:MAG TPA: porin, partial [Labilithrix sp.]|nr:porin [Labilithrix sp.]